MRTPTLFLCLVIFLLQLLRNDSFFINQQSVFTKSSCHLNVFRKDQINEAPKYAPKTIRSDSMSKTLNILRIGFRILPVFAINRPIIASSREVSLRECSDSISLFRSKAGKYIVLLGTAHISEDSVKTVRRIIKSVNPNVVMIELDMNRIQRIGSPQKMKELGFDVPSGNFSQLQLSALGGIENVPSENTSKVSFFSDIIQNFSGMISSMVSQGSGAALGTGLSQFYKSVEKLGFKAGGEFQAAVEEGRAIGARILLGDRDVNLTLERLARAISLTGPTRLLDLAERVDQLQEEAGIIDPGNMMMEKESMGLLVESLKQKKLIAAVMSLVKEVTPLIYDALIGERDLFMANAMIECNADVLVAVVGMAHMIGIEKILVSNNYEMVEQVC